MSEVIAVYTGQQALGIADRTHELYRIQHELAPDGHLLNPQGQPITSHLFHQTHNHQYIPRAVYSEGVTLRELKSKSEEKSQVNAMTLESIRREVQRCDNLQGFQLTSDLNTELICQQLRDSYPKKMQLGIHLLPRLSHSHLIPLNSLIQNQDFTVFMDSHAIQQACKHCLQIQKPESHHRHQLIAHHISNITAQIRYPLDFDTSLREMVQSYVPFHRVHFLSPHLAPLQSPAVRHYDPSLLFKAQQLFDVDSSALGVDVKQGKAMIYHLIFRGNFHNRDINPCVRELKANPEVRYVDWSIQGYRARLIPHPPMSFPNDPILDFPDGCIEMLTNHTSISSVFEEVVQQYEYFSSNNQQHQMQLSQRDKQQYNDAVESVTNLIEDYRQIATDFSESEEEDEDD